jgi:hypothetical protein
MDFSKIIEGATSYPPLVYFIILFEIVLVIRNIASHIKLNESMSVWNKVEVRRIQRIGYISTLCSAGFIIFMLITSR